MQRMGRCRRRSVLTDIDLAFEGVEVSEVFPPLDAVPDLFDVSPLVIHGRYQEAGTGTLRTSRPSALRSMEYVTSERRVTAMRAPLEVL